MNLSSKARRSRLETEPRAFRIPDMKLTVNGEERDVAKARLTVRELLAELDVRQTTGMAVARNMRVVPKSRWDEEALEEGDEIELVRATQGG